MLIQYIKSNKIKTFPWYVVGFAMCDDQTSSPSLPGASDLDPCLLSNDEAFPSINFFFTFNFSAAFDVVPLMCKIEIPATA